MNNLLNFICINAPAIIFPYIRAYVSTLTSLSGIPTIIMPTINMESVGRQLREIIQKEMDKN
ncbi:MAG: protein-export chaperone SecB [Prevotella sp.]|nr:protein-export chaperone SecB [Prevotella sp.]